MIKLDNDTRGVLFAGTAIFGLFGIWLFKYGFLFVIGMFLFLMVFTENKKKQEQIK